MAQEAELPHGQQPGGQQAPSSSKILVKNFKVTGNTVISNEELGSVTSSYHGKAMSIEELQEVATLLTDLYRKKGYTLASAYIPEQEIKEGIVEFVILEGRLGELIISGNRYYSTEFIRTGFFRVIKEQVIRNDSLERSLLLLNEYPDLKVSATLEPGVKRGTTNILAKAEEKGPLHIMLDYNNYGFNVISRNRFGARVEAGNLWFDGSLLTLNGIIGDNPDRLLFQTMAYSLPITSNGTKLVLSGSQGRFDVGAELDILQIRGKIRTYDISVTHPFIKTRFQTLLAEAGLASKDNRLFTLGQIIGDDRVRLLKLGINYDRLDRTGRNFFSLYGFQGLGEALGGMTDNDPVATRQGADNRFTKATLSTGRIQSLGGDALLILRGIGQASTGPRSSSNSFCLVGRIRFVGISWANGLSMRALP